MTDSPFGRGAVKKLRIDSSGKKPPRWNAHSARVFSCGFTAVKGQDRPDPFFHSSRGGP